MSTHLLLIDATEPAYTVYYKLPATQRDQLDLSGKDPALIHLIPWEERTAEHLLAHIQHNDYADVDIVAGLYALLDLADGAPIGLTWSGGVAITYRDYQHAKRTHTAWRLNPAAHTLSPRAQDPIHPLNHFEPLLGR
jgi:hypothetical protein